jgi:hypothetical protein
MSGDYSRETFNRTKKYSGVRMQQGRVQLDADWNEEHDIQNYRTETEAIDVIGQSGAPMKDGGFKIGTTSGGQDLTISAGRIYAGGLLLELDQPSTYTTQPHFPNPADTTVSSPPAGSPPGSARQLSLAPGIYLAYLDAWQREITALDDKLIREVALGGPDTTARIQNIWQVKLRRVTDSPSGSPPSPAPTCGSTFAAFDELTAPSTGMLNARTQPPGADDNPCLLPPSAGYRRLENQLYRVEIQTGGTRNEATFKWSRDNGSVATKITNVNDDIITVSDLGKDEVLNFAGGQWVEIVDEESTLKGTPHPLVQIDKIDAGTGEITLKTSVAALANRSGLKLRRWDQTGVAATTNGIRANLSNWIGLEGGIQVRFSSGQYRAGDYWLIPARTTTGEVEWPLSEGPNLNPLAQPPRGIHHHYCRLALIEVVGGVATVIDDCRNLFPPLTELMHFFYLGGAGQEALPGQRLPCPLQVGVMNGQLPVAGARVRFSVSENVGRLHAGGNSGQTLFVETDANGVAQCELELSRRVAGARERGCLEVVAQRVNPADGVFEPAVRFNFNPSIASQVAYDPKECPELARAEVRTVQEAIDRLCRRRPESEPGIKIRQIQTTLDKQGLRNDTLVEVHRLQQGLNIICADLISPVSVGGAPVPPPTTPAFPNAQTPGKPTCFVTLDLPYPLGREADVWDFRDIIGFQPLILNATVSVKESTISWNPTSITQQWLQNILFQRGLRNVTDRVLAHLTLKGNFIFSPDAKLYLDGEAFGRPNDNGRIDLDLPTGDDRKGGDFEMWFWLLRHPPEQPSPGINLAVTVSSGAAGGVVSGAVQDNNGAFVPNVTVSLTQLSTGVTKTAATNENGKFTFGGLKSGSYKVSVQVGGISAEQTVNVP